MTYGYGKPDLVQDGVDEAWVEALDERWRLLSSQKVWAQLAFAFGIFVVLGQLFGGKKEIAELVNFLPALIVISTAIAWHSIATEENSTSAKESRIRDDLERRASSTEK